MNKTFAELYSDGEVTEDAVDDHIDQWHSGSGEGLELHEYLGMTMDEFSLFLTDPDLCYEKIKERKNNNELHQCSKTS